MVCRLLAEQPQYRFAVKTSAQPAHPPGHPSPDRSGLASGSGQPPEAAGAADAGLCDQPMPSAPQKEHSK